MKQVFGFTIVITISVLLFSCSKKENTPDEGDQKKGITETELTSVNAYTTRIWFLYGCSLKAVPEERILLNMCRTYPCPFRIQDP